MVKMEIFGLALDEHSKSPILVLKDEAGLAVPIWIGAMEAMAISMALNKVPFPRPMTHDLLLSTITGLKGTVRRIEVTKVEEGTFYSDIIVKTADDLVRIDSRPSDAIALAVRAECNIFVDEEVITTAGAPFTEEGNETVMRTHDSDKWLDELEKFSEDETKYKM